MNHSGNQSSGFRRGRGRINLNANAWRRLRQVYADQPVALAQDLQTRAAGMWFSALERVAYHLSKASTKGLDVMFVIGHWRSGTTLLHEVLCTDPGFNFATTYACMNPQVFPITESAMLARFSLRSVPRPMDNVMVSLGSPQEDEFALLALGARSPYEGLLFPKALDRGMAIADPNDLDALEKEEWIRIFVRFLRQVAGRKPGCPIILKSPTHSYRVSLLSQLFPNARFVHVIRNPLEVYGSTLRMWNKLCLLYGLTDLPHENVLDRQVIANWLRLEQKLDAALPRLKEKQYVQVRYERLVAQPLQEMERVYSELGLGGFTSVLPHIERYLTTRTHLAQHATFSPSSGKAMNVFRAWRAIYDKYGYRVPT